MQLIAWKDSSPNDLLCVEWDVEPYTLTHLLCIKELLLVVMCRILISIFFYVDIDLRSIKCIVLECETCESWTLKKNDEAQINAFDTRELNQVIRVSWTVRRTNERVQEKAETE